jgi:hypothetical protein
MKRVNTSVSPPRVVRQQRTARQAVVKLWATVNRQHWANLDAASIILGDVARYGGESAGPVIWAHMVIGREDELRRGMA